MNYIKYFFRRACVCGVLMVSLFCLSRCKQQDLFDITGIWEFTLYYDNQSNNGADPPRIQYEFIGTQSSGDVVRKQLSGFQSGTYTVSNGAIQFTFNYGHGVAWSVSEFEGIIAEDHAMSGTFTSTLSGGQDPGTTDTGTWQAGKVQ